MAIALDTVSTGQQDGGSSITIAHTVSGSERLLLVLISAEDNANPNDMPVTGVTYNGVSLTKINEDRTDASPSGSADLVSSWYLIAPATGTHNVIVSYTGAIEGDAVTVMSLTGVHQSSPIDVQNVFKANSANPSNAVTTTVDNCLVVDVLTGSGSGTSLTADASQTERSSITNAGQIRSATSSEAKAVAGSVTMSWTMTSQVWAQSVIGIAPSTGSSPSLSISPSPSVSVSASISPSPSASVSPSSSISLSPSVSDSVSVSLSISPSPSVSVSLSVSPTPSLSVSSTPSPSPSPSSSISPSPSVSVSSSVSPSPSVSVSLSISPSPSV